MEYQATKSLYTPMDKKNMNYNVHLLFLVTLTVILRMPSQVYKPVGTKED